MQRWEKIKREDTLVRLVILIFAGAGLNVLVLILSLWKVTQQLYLNPPSIQPQIPFITTAPELTLLYLALTIIYSISASFSFVPKRVVSPVHIQITTATLLVIFSSYYFLSFQPPLGGTFIPTITVDIMLYYGILGGIGWLQAVLVRRIIAVSGTRENIDTKTFSINAPFKTISEILRERTFLRNNSLKSKLLDNRLIIQSSWDTTNKHVLVLDANQDDMKSTLAFSSFSIEYDSLRVTDSANLERVDILGSLEGRLKMINPNYKIEESYSAQAVTSKAESIALGYINSPFSELKNYSKKYTVIFGLLLGIAAIITIIHHFDHPLIDRPTWINSMIFLIAIALVEVFPLLREKVQERK
jgi:hypothetical protein